MIFGETARLRLRNVTPADAPVMFDYRNHPLCSRYQREQTKTRSGIDTLVQKSSADTLCADNTCFLAVALKETDEMIGEIIVMPCENTFSLGYTFSYRYHRQGYAFESLSLLIEQLHKAYPLWEFISFTHPDNQASMALLTKLGYENLGYLPGKDSQVFGKWITNATRQELAQAGAL